MSLPVIHSDTYTLHAPTFEIAPGGLVTQYFESPQRVDVILEALRATDWAAIRAPDEGRHDSLPLIVHDADYVGFVRDGYREWLATKPPVPSTGMESFSSTSKSVHAGNTKAPSTARRRSVEIFMCFMFKYL